MTFNRIKWVLGILVVFGIVIATNLIDRNNFKQMKSSVEAIYEERLVAKDLIFQISNAVHEKEVALATMDTSFFMNSDSKVSEELDILVAHYEETILSGKERKSFDNLKTNIKSLSAAKTSFRENGFTDKGPMQTELMKTKASLFELAKIQLNEGEKEMSKSKRALENVELFTQIEIYLLILLGIIVQFIVLYRPKKE